MVSTINFYCVHSSIYCTLHNFPIIFITAFIPCKDDEDDMPLITKRKKTTQEESKVLEVVKDTI